MMSVEKCPSCGTPYEPDATFCINCGAKRVAAPAGKEETAAPAEPSPPEKAVPQPPSEEDVLARLDQKIGEVSPEPKKKGKKGCCIAAVVAVVLLAVIAACIGGIYAYNAGWFEGLGAPKGFSYDFTSLPADKFAVWHKGPSAAVGAENGALKAHNALVGVKYDAGADYEVTVRVAVAGVDAKDGWAGPVLRVNAKGGDRYAFAVCPGEKTARIILIQRQGKRRMLAASRVEELALGKWFTVTATVSEQDLTMKVNGTVVARTTFIGLAEGPAGLEAHRATAYFDDLAITPQ